MPSFIYYHPLFLIVFIESLLNLHISGSSFFHISNLPQTFIFISTKERKKKKKMSARWIDQFLDQPKAKLFVRIDDEFLQNSFNVTGLKQKMAHFTPAYELIRRNTTTSARGEVSRPTIEREAEILYGLIHARFLLTRPGMQLMFEKYQRGEFQVCPRVYCKGTLCLPYGISEELGYQPLKMFCPCCNDVYNCTDVDVAKLDGAFFGPSWVHMFLQKFSAVVPRDPPRVYVPKIYGFRICHSSDQEEYSDSESD